MKIAVVGAGYVGLTVAACLAKLGHVVVGVEKDEARLAVLAEGGVPFFEPRLQEIIAPGLRHGHLTFTGRSGGAVASATLIVVAVGTPSGSDGRPDLSALDEAVTTIAPQLRSEQVVVLKSTVPVGTTDRVEQQFRLLCERPPAVACNPEFLREGQAVDDFLTPYRVIIGTRSKRAAGVLSELYTPLRRPIMVVDPLTAEMIKYACNAFLATKVSFINEVAAICEQTGADVGTVAAGMALDPRIGPHFLRPGIGFGGSCLPKDVRALSTLARAHGVTPTVAEAVLSVNLAQRGRFVEGLERIMGGVAGKTVAVLGLAFKGGTSDVRDSPALDIAARLLALGAVVRAFDPAAEGAATASVPALTCCPDAYEAAERADAITILTDWREFERLDWVRLRSRVRTPLIVDGRGLDIKEPARAAGFDYVGPSLRHAGSMLPTIPIPADVAGAGGEE